MQLGLADKHVVVTGAASGIGQRIARAFADEGSRVTLVGRNADRLSTVGKELSGNGHAWLKTDLLSDEAASRITSEIIAERGVIDVLVHAIGGSLGEEEPLAPLAVWLDIWRLNVGIAIEMNNVAIPSMQKAGWGRIVMISSIDATLRAGAPAYAAAKAYLNSYVRTVSWRIAKDGIVLSSLMPGPVLAPGNSWDKRLRENPGQVEEFIEARMPVGRLGTPDDLWPFVLVLASELSQWAIGTMIELDGGMTR